MKGMRRFGLLVIGTIWRRLTWITSIAVILGMWSEGTRGDVARGAAQVRAVAMVPATAAAPPKQSDVGARDRTLPAAMTPGQTGLRGRGRSNSDSRDTSVRREIPSSSAALL
jgi:hypothetical protein